MGGSVKPRSSMLIGARLGSYELTRLVGHGATASVFEGVHVALGRRVAVKVLHEHLVHDGQIAARFLREGRVAARLQHPHVVEVLDLGQEGDLAWLVMEFLEGRDLRAELARRGSLPVQEAVALVLPIASALTYAHGRGAVHRDLKPGNIFLARDELERIVPKLVDFGLSKLEGLAEDKALTASEVVAGSASYMAPEQTYGIGRAGPASDQFALGVVLYECLTGRAPFTARTLYELVDRIRESHPRPPSQEREGLPPGLDGVVLRALAHEPGERWPTVRAMGAELLSFADEETRGDWAAEFSETPSAGRHLVASPRGLRVPPPSSTLERTEPTHRCPPLPRRAGTSPFTIKGLAYRGFVHLVSQALPGGLDDLVDALDDGTLREFVTQPFLASSRYDVLPLRPLTARLAELVARPVDFLVEEAAGAQARYDSRTVFRQMFGNLTLATWHLRSARLGDQYYGFGRIEAECERAGEVVLRHVGMPAYVVPWYAPMQRGYCRETVRLLGGRDVVAESLAPVAGPAVDGLDTVTASTLITWTA